VRDHLHESATKPAPGTAQNIPKNIPRDVPAAESAPGDPGLYLIRRADGLMLAVYGNDGPTPERLLRGDVERVDTYVVDWEGTGRRARASRALDLMGIMARNGSIDAGMAGAGRRFAALFAQARFADVRAASLETRVSGAAARGELSDRAVWARIQVAKVIAALGGHGAAAAEAAWHVLGVGLSIEEWARRERWGRGRPLHKHAARGILIGALCAIQAALAGQKRGAGRNARSGGA
jgi:hypothetical protein